MSIEPRPKKLLEQVDDAIRLMHYSPRTGETYAHWIKRFILFHDKRHPKDIGAAEVQAFLTYLAIDQKRRCFHAKSGAQRPALSLSPCPTSTPGPPCRGRPRQET